MTKPRKIAAGIAVAALALCGIGAAFSGGDKPAPAADNAAATTTATTQPATTATTQPAKPKPAATTATTPAKPALTVAQQNAARSAQEYLDMTGFSRSGLIKQLAYEGFSTADATVAVDSLGVDWMKQAERTAAEYMSMEGFSRSGLIKQLEFEGYTAKQAAHGADSVGL